MTCSEVASRIASTTHDPEQGIHAKADGPAVRVVTPRTGSDNLYLVVESCGRFSLLFDNGHQMDLGASC